MLSQIVAYCKVQHRQMFVAILAIVIASFSMSMVWHISLYAKQAVHDALVVLGVNQIVVQTPFETMHAQHVHMLQSNDMVKTISRSVYRTWDYNQETFDVVGVDDSFFAMRQQSISQGRMLHPLDEQYQRRVCVIGSEVNRLVFHNQGYQKWLDTSFGSFMVVGVLESDGGSLLQDDNRGVFVPISWMQEGVEWWMIDVTIDEQVASERLELFLKQHCQTYQMVLQKAIIEAMDSMLDMLQKVFFVISLSGFVISLVTIYQTMMHEVKMRYEEIGIRKAVGYHKGSILFLFFSHSQILVALGNGVGMMLYWILYCVLRNAASIMIPIDFYYLLCSSLNFHGLSLLVCAVPILKAYRVDVVECLQ